MYHYNLIIAHREAFKQREKNLKNEKLKKQVRDAITDIYIILDNAKTENPILREYLDTLIKSIQEYEAVLHSSTYENDIDLVRELRTSIDKIMNPSVTLDDKIAEANRFLAYSENSVLPETKRTKSGAVAGAVIGLCVALTLATILVLTIPVTAPLIFGLIAANMLLMTAAASIICVAFGLNADSKQSDEKLRCRNKVYSNLKAVSSNSFGLFQTEAENITLEQNMHSKRLSM